MLELGKSSIDYHKQIGEFINELSFVKNIYLYGILVNNIKQELKNKKVKCFTEKSVSCKELIKDIAPNCVVYIEGSRGMQLDVIYNEIVETDKLKREYK